MIETKLDRIRLKEVEFEDLPLGEVLKMLAAESKEQDPEHVGINFLFNPHPTVPVFSTNDPTASVFTPASSSPAGLDGIKIHISPTQHDVRLADVLDLISSSTVPASLADLAHELNLPKSSLHGLCGTGKARAFGNAERDPQREQHPKTRNQRVQRGNERPHQDGADEAAPRTDAIDPPARQRRGDEIRDRERRLDPAIRLVRDIELRRDRRCEHGKRRPIEVADGHRQRRADRYGPRCRSLHHAPR